MSATAHARPPCPEPNLYPGVPRETYHAWDAANYSVVKLFEKSAAHAREALLHPRAPTEAMTRGGAVHAAVLEPDRFAREYVEAPVLDRRRKADKLAWEAFEAEHAGQVPLDPEDWAACQAVKAAAWGHETPRRLLSTPGYTELSVVAKDRRFGIPLKARPDRFLDFLGIPTILDVKTTRDASPQGFRTEIARYSYHVQAAFYLRVLDALSLHGGRAFLFLACETVPPYACATYQLDEDSLKQGESEVELYLERYSEAIETGVWPGYPGGILTARIPRWRFTAEVFDGV